MGHEVGVSFHIDFEFVVELIAVMEKIGTFIGSLIIPSIVLEIKHSPLLPNLHKECSHILN